MKEPALDSLVLYDCSDSELYHCTLYDKQEPDKESDKKRTSDLLMT